MANKINTILSDARTYWKIPMPGRYMTFKEIAAYAGGGIGAYFLIYMGGQLAVNINNMIVGGAIGLSPTHMYILYVIATLANIPLTAVRANMIDNTRNKAGKYRPYLISMGIPTIVIALAYVWFPYDSLYGMFPNEIFGYEGGYVAKAAVVLFFNLLLQFFFNFFSDAYTNLIHVLSPNTQERTDVLAIKSVVYSLAPSIANIILPVVSQYLTNNRMDDIRLYRVTYPVFSLIGIGLTIVVFANTKEKIVQAKTRVVQVRFVDSFKSVAKNKYFWIIALAGWLGFLEGSYGNIMNWTYNYGHACNGTTMGIINTVVGNASMWGMIIAPFCIRRFGKKNVLIGVNTMNIVCILAMGLNRSNIYWLAICVYFNWLFGAFEQITTPAIQADIRDFHQYKTGERIDGMFATVQTIGNIVTLVTSSIIPFVYEHYGIYEGNGYENSLAILDVETGEPGLLPKIVGTIILMAAFGAFLNMVPYLFYDLKEKDQRGIIRVLKIRAMFEDYGNGVRNDAELVEAIDIIREARETAVLPLKEIDKKLSGKERRKLKAENEEIEIAKFVVAELEKFSSKLVMTKVAANEEVYRAGLAGLFNANMDDINAELAAAKIMPSGTPEEKELRKFAIEIAKNKKASRKAITKRYKSVSEFVQPDFAAVERLYNREDAADERIRELYLKRDEAKKAKDKELVTSINVEIKALKLEKKQIEKDIKVEMDKHADFARAAKPYLDAEKLMKDKENYAHFDDIAAMYEESKAAAEAARQAKIDEQKRLEEEKAAKTRQLKEEKEAAKAAKKLKK
ncbi:MAG: MFS transporter [Clostridia bacterium]|nr:MFS transporter [Clostridia bacterium]